MSSLFEQIGSLKAEWDTLQPLAPQDERRLWLKLRLEWNYHSNHIEGNTLTYGETVLLLLHGQTHGNHLMREYEEMKAHDVGIAYLRELAADHSRLISPKDIRDLNGLILKEPFWKPVITQDGRPGRSQVIPGEYKTLPNSVLTSTGEVFEYAAPFEVPARMQALIDWLGVALEKDEFHAVEIAAKLHHDFVLIHPFDDGNGRIARMLMNYVLLRAGYPPVVVPTERKNDYLTALRLADAGDLGSLVSFFAELVEKALRLGIRAGKGESVEEPSDAEKEVALFLKAEKSKRFEQSLPQPQDLANFAKISLIPLVQEIERKLISLKPLFAGYEVVVRSSGGSRSDSDSILYAALDFPKPGGWVTLEFRFLDYKEGTARPFSYDTLVSFHFEPAGCLMRQDEENLATLPYSSIAIAEEGSLLSSRVLSKSLGAIRQMADPWA